MMSPQTGGAAPDRHLCLIVPCYNEAHRLDVQSFRRFLCENTCTRVLFVDDGSSDNTLQVLEEVCRGFGDHAQVLRADRNGGKGEAVRIGFNYALAHFDQPVVGFWDADLATPLWCVNHLLRVLERDPSIEMVFGARVNLLGRHVERRAVRHYLGRIFATAVSTVLHMPIYDTQCGAKLFRVTPQLKQVFAEPFLSKWVFDVEILARLLALRGNDPKLLQPAIYEYPLEAWVDKAGSKVSAADFFVAFWDIVRIRQKYLRRRA
jgi:glycosyltransferase involved in cell wall biosynthesis